MDNTPSFRTMTPDQLFTDLALRRFEPPLNKLAHAEMAAMTDLGMVLLFLDFDSEVLMGGILAFIENSSGHFLNHTIEMFRRIKATQTESVLRGIKAIMDKHGVTTASLQADTAGNPEYTISTFTERHGADVSAIADEFDKVPGKIYTEHGATEDAYALITAYVKDHFDAIVTQLEKRLA